MTALRRERLEKAQRDALEAIDSAITEHCIQPISHHSSCYIYHGGPTALDIVWMPEIEALFVDSGSASDVVAGLEAVISHIPPLVVRWEKYIRDKLRDMISDLFPTITVNIDPLELAVAVFSCDKCETPATESEAPTLLALRYPDVLTHKCFRKHHVWVTSDWPLPITTEYQRSIIDLERYARCRCPLLPERISMAGAQRASAALLQANCDPNTTTYAEMQTWERRGGLLVPPSAERPQSSRAYIALMLEAFLNLLFQTTNRSTGMAIAALSSIAYIQKMRTCRIGRLYG